MPATIGSTAAPATTMFLGGDGDDINTDTGGDDTMHGDAGNDVIHGGNGFNLLFGDAGQDFIITGEDATSTVRRRRQRLRARLVAQPRHDRRPGDDWLEFGHQGGTAWRHADPAGRDLTEGHDVFVGGPGFEVISSEGGDDIIFGSEGQEKMSGASGFDWADYKFEQAGVTVDMKLQIDRATPATPSMSALLDLYSFVEGLSGSAFADVLCGDDAVLADFPFAGAQGSVLDAAGIARIAGLQSVLGAGVTSFSSGNIILGGAGSDIIEGRRGDDIIDGDRWLDARISVRDAINHAIEIRSVDSMRSLVPEMIAGTLNPSQLEIGTRDQDRTGQRLRHGGVLGHPRQLHGQHRIRRHGNRNGQLRDGQWKRGHRHTARHRAPAVRRYGHRSAGRPANAAPVGLLTISHHAHYQSGADGFGCGRDRRGHRRRVDRRQTDHVPSGRSEAGHCRRARHVLEDIVLPNGLGGAPTAAQGSSLRLPSLSAVLPSLSIEGANIRVHAVYQDDHGVPSRTSTRRQPRR